MTRAGPPDVRYPLPVELADMAIAAHHVVEASAGTGKTYLIERRVIDLILRGGASIDQILLVTFTEKATAELRGRVRALLRELVHLREDRAAADRPHWLIDRAARGALRAALAGFDQAAIRTIHGFCHGVLLDSAFEAGRPFRQTQVATESALRDAIHDSLRDRLAADPEGGELLEAWLARRRRVDDLGQLFGEILRAGGRVVQRYRPDEIGRRLDQLADAIDRHGLDRLRAELRARRVHAGTAGAMARRAERLCELAEERRALGVAAVLTDLAEPTTALADLAWPDEPGPELALVRDGARALAGELVSLSAAVAIRFLPVVRERLERNKAERGQFDFGDMLEKVWLALEGPGGPALAERLRARHPYALIDEFQDTDELQWRIFRRLYLESAGGGHLTVVADPKQSIYGFRGADVETYLLARRDLLEHRTGCPTERNRGDASSARRDEASLEFPVSPNDPRSEQRRNATQIRDLATEGNPFGALGGERAPIRLAVNHRLTPPLVRALDHIFGGDPPFFSRGIEYRPVEAAPAAPPARAGAGAPVRVLDLRRLDGSADTRRAALAARISAEIARILGAPAAAGLSAGLGPGGIFVLTRAIAESREMADRLRADGIRCALYQQEGLLQTSEAAEVRDLLAAVATPRDRSARLRAWQTRFFAVPLAELGRLAEVDDSHPMVAPLFEWRALAERLDYERLFPRILADTRLCERELALAPSERGLANFLHLFEILLDEMLGSRCDVDELVRRFGRWMVDSEGADERNVQRLESERDAVQIMTIHRAKGLQAEVVFLYGCDGKGRQSEARTYHADDERRIQIGRARDQSVRAACAAEERGENQRLLYVALTRAAARLYLPCWSDAPDPAGRKLSDLLDARLLPHLGGEDARAPCGLPGLVDVEVIADIPPPRAADRVTAALAGWRPPPEARPDRADGRALGDERAPGERTAQRGPVTTSYTRMKHADRAGATGIDDLDEREDRDDEVSSGADLEVEFAPTVAQSDETGARARSDAAATRSTDPGAGRRVGIFLHQVLEEIPLAPALDEPELAGWSARADVDQIFRRAARRHDVDPDEPAWRRMVWDTLRAPIDLGRGDVIAGVARAERSAREVEFLFQLCDGDGRETAIVRGAIDLVFERGGRVYWLDWKSDRLADYAPASLAAHVRAEYELQADIYSLALARMLGARSAAEYDARFGGLVYLFLRGAAAHVERPEFADLARREAALAARDHRGATP